MRAANLETSERLQRVAALLDDGLWHSTRDIVMHAEVMAVSACISELRSNGVQIESKCEGKRWFYRNPAAAQAGCAA